MTAHTPETSALSFSTEQRWVLAYYPDIRPEDLGLLDDFLFFMG
jgi:hypothetical protein